MIGADKDCLVPALCPAHGRATVRASIDKPPNVPILVTIDDDWLTADIGSEKIVRPRNLAFVRQVDPGALKDVFHLKRKDLCLPEYRPIDHKQALLWTINDVRLRIIGAHVLSSLFVLWSCWASQRFPSIASMVTSLTRSPFT
jgi:hypothetical protein